MNFGSKYAGNYSEPFLIKTKSYLRAGTNKWL